MSPFEIRLIAYAVLALVTMGGAAWGAHVITSHHYERLMAADKLAQDTALQEAQQKVIAAQTERAAATQQVEKAHELLVQADSASRAAVVGSVRNLEAALHLGGLSAAMGHSAQSGGAGSGTASADGLDATVATLNAAIEHAVQTCQHDSTELIGILALAPKS